MKIPAVLAVAAVSALTLSACGSGSSSATNTTVGSSSGGGSAGGVHVASTSLGNVLVDGSGMTLYVLSADGHDHSTCNAQCLQFWPPVAPGKAARTVAATGTTSTTTGGHIATVAGHPVYTFSLDHKPGDVNGEGVNEFGGVWYAVSASGAPVMSSSSSGGSSSGSSSGNYGGGGY